MSDNREDQMLIVFVVDTSGSMFNINALTEIESSLQTMISNMKSKLGPLLPNLRCAIIIADSSLDNGAEILKQPQKIKALGSIRFEGKMEEDTLGNGIKEGQALIANYYANTELHSPPILIAITDSSGSKEINNKLSKKILQDVNEGEYIFWTHVFSEEHNNFDHLKNLVSDDIIVNYNEDNKLKTLLHDPLFDKLREFIRHQDEDMRFLKRELEQNNEKLKRELEQNNQKFKQALDWKFERFKDDLAKGVDINIKKQFISLKGTLNYKLRWIIGVFFSVFAVNIVVNIYVYFSIENNYYEIININYNPEITVMKKELNDSLLKEVINVLPPDVNVSIDLEYNYENETVKSDCEDCDNTLILRYTLEDTISKYSLGKYHVISNKTTQLSAQYVEKRIESLLKKFDLRGAFKVKLQGETDAVPIRKEGIPYEGEFGAIAGEVYFNRTQKPEEMGGIYLAWNDTIHTNEELAFLRAYAFKEYLSQWTKPFIIKPPTYQYYIKTNNEKKGGNYRKVVIEVYFYSIIKKSDTYEISST